MKSFLGCVLLLSPRIDLGKYSNHGNSQKGTGRRFRVLALILRIAFFALAGRGRIAPVGIAGRAGWPPVSATRWISATTETRTMLGSNPGPDGATPPSGPKPSAASTPERLIASRAPVSGSRCVLDVVGIAAPAPVAARTATRAARVTLPAGATGPNVLGSKGPIGEVVATITIAARLVKVALPLLVAGAAFAGAAGAELPLPVAMGGRLTRSGGVGGGVVAAATPDRREQPAEVSGVWPPRP